MNGLTRKILSLINKYNLIFGLKSLNFHKRREDPIDLYNIYFLKILIFIFYLVIFILLGW